MFTPVKRNKTKTVAIESMESRVMMSAVSFGTPSSVALSTIPNYDSAIAANFNGHIDFLMPVTHPTSTSAQMADGTEILLGNGQGKFTEVAGPAEPGAQTFFGGPIVAVGDFNGDGKQDFVYVITNQNSAKSGNMEVLPEFGNGNGTFKAGPMSVVTGAPLTSPAYVTTGYFTGNGRLDLALMVEGPSDKMEVFICYNNGKGSFTSQKLNFTGPGFATNVFEGIFAENLTEDGRTDLVVYGAGELSTLLNTGTSNGQATFKVVMNNVKTVDSGSFDVATARPLIGDFNGDKIPDVAIAEEPLNGSSLGTVQVFFGNGAGTFTRGPQTTNAALNSFHVIAGDFNGKESLATLTALLPGTGNGKFATPVATNLPAQAAQNQAVALFAEADINGDGMLDLAALYTNYNKSGVVTSDTFEWVLAR